MVGFLHSLDLLFYDQHLSFPSFEGFFGCSASTYGASGFLLLGVFYCGPNLMLCISFFQCSVPVIVAQSHLFCFLQNISKT